MQSYPERVRRSTKWTTPRVLAEKTRLELEADGWRLEGEVCIPVKILIQILESVRFRVAWQLFRMMLALDCMGIVAHLEYTILPFIRRATDVAELEPASRSAT